MPKHPRVVSPLLSGTQIRDLRLSVGLTATGVAKALGYRHRSTIYSWETGYRPIPIEAARAFLHLIDDVQKKDLDLLQRVSSHLVDKPSTNVQH